MEATSVAYLVDAGTVGKTVAVASYGTVVVDVVAVAHVQNIAGSGRSVDTAVEIAVGTIEWTNVANLACRQ